MRKLILLLLIFITPIKTGLWADGHERKSLIETIEDYDIEFEEYLEDGHYSTKKKFEKLVDVFVNKKVSEGLSEDEIYEQARLLVADYIAFQLAEHLEKAYKRYANDEESIEKALKKELKGLRKWREKFIFNGKEEDYDTKKAYLKDKNKKRDYRRIYLRAVDRFLKKTTDDIYKECLRSVNDMKNSHEDSETEKLNSHERKLIDKAFTNIEKSSSKIRNNSTKTKKKILKELRSDGIFNGLIESHFDFNKESLTSEIKKTHAFITKHKNKREIGPYVFSIFNDFGYSKHQIKETVKKIQKNRRPLRDR